MNQHSDTDDTGKENGISTTTYAKVQAGYGYTTGSYNIGGTASDESTSTASFKVNANLTLGSGGTWNLSSGSEWSQSKMTDTEAYKGQGSLSLANSALPAVYSSNVHESGSSTTVDTDVNAWTVVNGGWSQTTQYVGSDDTSENYFDFTAKNTFSDPSLAPPDKGGIYTMHISSDTSSEQITASDFGYYLSTTTNWGQGEDSYNNVSSGVSMSDSWSMSKGGQNHVTGSWAGQDPPSYDTTVSYPGFGHVPGWDMSYYGGYLQNSGNPYGLVTPGFKTPGATNNVTPPYNVPQTPPPSASTDIRNILGTDLSNVSIGDMTTVVNKYPDLTRFNYDSSAASKMFVSLPGQNGGTGKVLVFEKKFTWLGLGTPYWSLENTLPEAIPGGEGDFQFQQQVAQTGDGAAFTIQAGVAVLNTAFAAWTMAEQIGVQVAQKAVPSWLNLVTHHQLPRQFEEDFVAAGIEDIEEFTVTISRLEHGLLPNGLHTGEMSWNWQWGQFFRTLENPNTNDVLDFLSSLRDAFGLD